MARGTGLESRIQLHSTARGVGTSPSSHRHTMRELACKFHEDAWEGVFEERRDRRRWSDFIKLPETYLTGRGRLSCGSPFHLRRPSHTTEGPISGPKWKSTITRIASDLKHSSNSSNETMYRDTCTHEREIAIKSKRNSYLPITESAHRRYPSALEKCCCKACKTVAKSATSDTRRAISARTSDRCSFMARLWGGFAAEKVGEAENTKYIKRRSTENNCSTLTRNQRADSIDMARIWEGRTRCK